MLDRIGMGDTLVVVRIDRLARSLSHLLEVIERLEAMSLNTHPPRTRTMAAVIGEDAAGAGQEAGDA